MKFPSKYKLLIITFASLVFISACQKKTTTTERNENIQIVSPFSGSDTEGQCYKITAENKDYYGRLDKNGHPLQIPELKDKDIKVSLSLLTDRDCKEKGI
ncbi:hypothetical protein LDO51_17945 [Providencia alcalifaciens]|uniref:hypothetical protein n=1 Tax=Providencia alcalifaciens TaxID=126385 RepID=UPI001CE1F3D6|nr:hypothetical protein [Providencia alcalifaciens]UBX48989.1 hypothetical protein LDO51_17945 [Providencia alcalifaciens]